MSERTEGYVLTLWTLIDEILNVVLFILIGLEVLVLERPQNFALIAVVAIPIVLVSRSSR